MPDYTNELKIKPPKGGWGTKGYELLEQIEDAREGMVNMFKDMAGWDKFYYGKLPAKREPWENCANICVPLIQSHVDSYKARLVDTMFGVQPVMLVQPPAEMESQEGAKELAKRVENLLETQTRQKMNLAKTMRDDVIPYALRNQAAVTMVVWEEDYRTVREVVKQPIIEQDPFTGQPIQVGEEEAIAERRVPKYRGPKVKHVDLRNFCIWPLTSSCVEDAYLIGHKYRLSADDIRRKVAEKQFDKSALELVDALVTESSSGGSTTTDREDEHIDDYTLVEKSDKFDELWFWDVITGYPGKDGLNEDCKFTLEAETGTVVRAQKYPYFHGRRYYVRWAGWPEPGRFFGRSLPMILEHLQREINTIHNMRTDATSLAMTKAFLVMASRRPDYKDVKLYPGAQIEVTDQNEVTELKIDPVIPGVDLESINRDWAERSDAVNDMSLGRETEGDKTATEASIVNTEGGLRFSEIIDRLQESTVEVGKQILGLCAQFMEDEELAQFQLTRDQLMLDWVIVPHGNRGTSNKVQQRLESKELYAMLMQNPLVAMDPKRIWQITSDLLTSYDREDASQYIGTIEDIEQMMQAQQQAAQQQQAQEAQMMEQQAMMEREQVMQKQEMDGRKLDMEEMSVRGRTARDMASAQAAMAGSVGGVGSRQG